MRSPIELKQALHAVTWHTARIGATVWFRFRGYLRQGVIVGLGRKRAQIRERGSVCRYGREYGELFYDAKTGGF